MMVFMIMLLTAMVGFIRVIVRIEVPILVDMQAGTGTAGKE